MKMDVCVKQAYDRLVTICDKVEDLDFFSSGKDDIRRVLAEDIFCFIKRISKDNAEDRYCCFDTEYQNNAYPIQNLTNINAGKRSELFDHLNAFSLKMKDKLQILPDEIYVAFFAELGKYYLFSLTDKRDIDRDKYLTYIKTLQDCIARIKRLNL